MKKLTKQQKLVRDKLLEDGEITLAWATQHYIQRLSERIRELNSDKFNGASKVDPAYQLNLTEGRYMPGTRNTRYTLLEQPRRVVYQPVEVNGVVMMRPQMV